MNAAPPFDQSPIPFVGTIHRALIYRVHDGDTMWPVVDVGFGAHFSNPEKGIRLVGPNAKGFNAPELNATDPAIVTAAKASRDRVIALVQGKFVYVESWPPNGDDKYGRWLMAVYVPVATLVPREIGPGETANVAQPINVNTGPTGVTGPLVPCFDLASQLVAEGLGVWQVFT